MKTKKKHNRSLCKATLGYDILATAEHFAMETEAGNEAGNNVPVSSTIEEIDANLSHLSDIFRKMSVQKEKPVSLF